MTQLAESLILWQGLIKLHLFVFISIGEFRVESVFDIVKAFSTWILMMFISLILNLMWVDLDLHRNYISSIVLLVLVLHG